MSAMRDWRRTKEHLHYFSTPFSILTEGKAQEKQLLLLLFFKDFYLFMRDTERERQTQAEGEAGSMQGAWHGTQSPISRITPWVAGSTKLLCHRGCPENQLLKMYPKSIYTETWKNLGPNLFIKLPERAAF